jgi:sugar-specific transcriptional regulator TrmB
VHSALKEFGLSAYATRAFIALILNGVSSAKEISNMTNIPYSRIYDVLVNLEGLGFVRVISGRPMRYRAERPAKVAKIVKKRLDERFQRIEAALIERLEPLYGNANASEEVDATPIWILTGDIVRKIAEKTENCKKIFRILLKNPNEALLNGVFEHLLAMSSRRVKIEVIVGKKHFKMGKKMLWRKLMSIGRVMVVPSVIFDGFIFDDEEMLVFLTSFFNVAVREEQMMFWISDQRLNAYTSTYFKMLWNSGTQFTLREDADGTDADPEPDLEPLPPTRKPARTPIYVVDDNEDDEEGDPDEDFDDDA